MPTRIPTLSERDVRDYVLRHCLRSSDDHRVGLEVEWLTLDARDPTRRIPFEQLSRAALRAPLPGGCRITFEPGGQLELSSPPLPGVQAAIDAVRADSAAVGVALAAENVSLEGVGLDARRPHRRIRNSPRYVAMEAFFDADGAAGRRMMCGTAAIQVNLDLGTDAERRWRLAHALGPVLAAMFANSPVAGGVPTGYRSTRMANWFAMDPTRTAPARNGRAAAEEWAAYALAARVMLVRVDETRFEPVFEHLSFGGWIARGSEFGYPTEGDLAYHLTTLFPPVRPRGWLELRMIDALPDRWWPVAAAVTVALLDDPEASAIAEVACAPVADAWTTACRDGLGDPSIARVARACFRAALDALPRLGVDTRTRDAAAAYHDRFVARGRTPADELLEMHPYPVPVEVP